jgi:hypothetical protein
MNANIFCNKCHRIPSQCGCGRVLGYELADELQETEPYYSTDYKLFDKAASMLRQQADRIAELEKGEEVAGRFYWESVVDGHVMAVPSEGTPHYNKDDFPLYTTPQIKELSDEEILSFTGFKNNPYDIFIEYEKEDLIKFARAILKKASEK